MSDTRAIEQQQPNAILVTHAVSTEAFSTKSSARAAANANGGAKAGRKTFLS
ncbi:hypothetical protein B0A54_11166 [Friedmanniomyces endolithicus]|uniref:Uncharacterized protein n=1 Tax=Friedmanniomyces endolithicus TaxID=329885 RepID=A0A4U0URW5_9PEZI|nr:hypothetical protein B0A54_11166 [Friedmanniomyces endolithicus]